VSAYLDPARPREGKLEIYLRPDRCSCALATCLPYDFFLRASFKEWFRFQYCVNGIPAVWRVLLAQPPPIPTSTRARCDKC
jgi:hypothetical protein